MSVESTQLHGALAMIRSAEEALCHAIFADMWTYEGSLLHDIALTIEERLEELRNEG